MSFIYDISDQFLYALERELIYFSPTLDYLIAVGYQINVALGIFPEIDKHSLLNNCSFGKNFKKLINIALSTSKNVLIRHVVYSS